VDDCFNFFAFFSFDDDDEEEEEEEERGFEVDFFFDEARDDSVRFVITNLLSCVILLFFL
jgi:hypothetical protein